MSQQTTTTEQDMDRVREVEVTETVTLLRTHVIEVTGHQLERLTTGATSTDALLELCDAEGRISEETVTGRTVVNVEEVDW